MSAPARLRAADPGQCARGGRAVRSAGDPHPGVRRAAAARWTRAEGEW
ncbi:hypothetical protein [Streptomyces sp. NPDC006368]